MTINRRTIRSLRDARWRLRDLALAEHASVSDFQLKAEELLAAASETLEVALDTAGAAMGVASSIAELDLISQRMAAHHVCLDEASTEYAAAVALTEAAAAKLRERTRLARSAEHLLDRYERESARRETREEQRSQDDRRRRSTSRVPKLR